MVKFLKSVNIPFDERPLCCEDCGHYSNWENYNFDAGEEVYDELRVDLGDLIEGVDYVLEK